MIGLDGLGLPLGLVWLLLIGDAMSLSLMCTIIGHWRSVVLAFMSFDSTLTRVGLVSSGCYSICWITLWCITLWCLLVWPILHHSRGLSSLRVGGLHLSSVVCIVLVVWRTTLWWTGVSIVSGVTWIGLECVYVLGLMALTLWAWWSYVYRGLVVWSYLEWSCCMIDYMSCWSCPGGLVGLV